MDKIISILGCGWLGVPLGKYLVGQGFTVKGSVRNSTYFDELKQAGIQPFKIWVESDGLHLDDESFFTCDTLIISLPPGRKDGQVHLFTEKVRHIRSYIDTYKIPNVIFISSTSVYPDKMSIVHEEDAIAPTKHSGQILLQSEQLLQAGRSYNLTILRLAGLIGLDRNPVRFIEKGNDPKNANVPMNLIHIDDVIGVLDTIISHELWNETFNACGGVHPTRQEFYKLAANLTGKPEPKFSSEAPSAYKLISSNKFLTLSGYQFKYNNPLDYVKEIYGS